MQNLARHDPANTSRVVYMEIAHGPFLVTSGVLQPSNFNHKTKLNAFNSILVFLFLSSTSPLFISSFGLPAYLRAFEV